MRERLHVATLSQAALSRRNGSLAWGMNFEERPDGLRGLEAAYGLKFAGSPRTMDLGLLYRAIEQRQVDIIAGELDRWADPRAGPDGAGG